MGYYTGDVRKLFEDIDVLKPTIFVTVPRLLGRLYDKVMEAVRIGGIKQAMFDKAYGDKLADLKLGYYTNTLWDNLVFSKVKGKLGGNVRFIITGSAPISPNLLDFLRICFCCPVLEGYGQTETCASGTRTLWGDTDTGHVGIPQPSIELKLVDVPEMNYFSTDQPPRGEICFRGPTCTSGYYNNPEKTKETIDENGWIHTGDVGCLFPNGNVKIIDRKKNIFKLSVGEYVAPEKLENFFNQSKFVSQSFIYGDSIKASVVGIIVPDSEVLLKWAEDNNHASKGNLPALCQDEAINKMILDDMIKVGKKNDLKGFEFPKKIFLSPELFSVENDLLTPTFKLKRAQAKDRYMEQINLLYEGVD
jgi:long-chain acyl-CoA synthetase